MLHFIDSENRHNSKYQRLLEQSYRVRYDLYVKGRGWKALDRPDGREIDQFDTNDAKYLIWADGEDVIGGARLVPTSKPHLMSDIFPQIVTLGEVPRDAKIWELTRLFTSRSGNSTVNRKSVTREVFCAMFEVGIVFGLKAITVVCDTFFLPRLLERGVEATPLGLPTPYPEGTCIAIIMPVSIEQLIAARSGDNRGTVLFDIDTSAHHSAPVYAQPVPHAR